MEISGCGSVGRRVYILSGEEKLRGEEEREVEKCLNRYGIISLPLSNT
jgi:hypothetical protein